MIDWMQIKNYLSKRQILINLELEKQK